MSAENPIVIPAEEDVVIISDDEEVIIVSDDEVIPQCELRSQLDEFSYQYLLEMLREQAEEDAQLGLCMCSYCKRGREFKYVSIFIDVLCNPLQ